MSVWNILGIPPTRDAAKIRRAYVEKARKCHPEEDPEGFRRLHEAYREAMRDAREEESRDASGEEGGRHPVLLAGGGNLRSITVGGSAGQDEGEASPIVPCKAEDVTEDTLSFASVLCLRKPWGGRCAPFFRQQLRSRGRRKFFFSSGQGGGVHSACFT
ncbi:J domain-containing protein [Desulfovibrio sp. OH1186_COT-070]|nr:J domain-containing protein [Desulfovibrio sp. OH1209_COT-279]RRD87116.1 J domain-containing protein [Desulfovibrio sp. OH1186_COT-070]